MYIKLNVKYLLIGFLNLLGLLAQGLKIIRHLKNGPPGNVKKITLFLNSQTVSIYEVSLSNQIKYVLFIKVIFLSDCFKMPLKQNFKNFDILLAASLCSQQNV